MTALRSTARGRWIRRPLTIAAAGALALVAVPGAQAAPEDQSEAEAQLIDVEVVDVDTLEAIRTASGNPSDPGPNTANIDVDVLAGLIGLEIGSIDLPLIGDGENDGLLDFGDQADAGLLNGYASSPDGQSSVAASGAVGSDGGIDLGAGSSTDMARVDLTALLGQLSVDGRTDEIIDEVSLELGALASRAEATGDSADRDYMLAGADLTIHSPLVAGLSGGLDTALGQVSDDVNDLLDSGGDIQSALDDLAIDPITVPGLLTLDIGSPQLDATVDLQGITNDVLTEALVSDNELVTIDVSTGSIHVDLAQLHGGDLNHLAPNTQLLTSGEITQITDTVTTLLTELTGQVGDAVQDALLRTDLHLTIDPDLESVGGLMSGDIDITLDGTLSDFLGQGDDPEVGVTGTVSVAGSTVPVGDILDGIAEPILTGLVPGIGTALEPTLDDSGRVVDTAVGEFITDLGTTLDPVLEGVLDEIVTITVNAQEQDESAGTYTVSALELALVPAEPLASVTLATSSVRASVVEAAIEVSPGEVGVGDTVTVVGEGFTPNSDVELTYTDSGGNEVGTSTVGSDADGNITDDFEVPTGTELGTLTVTAIEGDNEAADTTEVTDSDPGGDQDGDEDYDPAIEAEPGEVEVGDTIIVEGSDYVPGSTVTVTYTDSSGEDVGQNDVTVDDEGAFGDTLVVPDGTALGDLTITATGEDQSATDSVSVVEPIAGQQGGTGQDGAGDSGGLPSTGAPVLALGAVAVLMLLGGAGMLRSRRAAGSM